MNDLQKVIFNVIVNIANTPDVFKYKNSTLFGLRNYISRYSLGNDKYFVSEKAYSLFDEHKLKLPLLRSKLRKLKKHFTYEHPVPSSVVLKHIKNSNKTADEIKAILQVADCVTLVTKEEDKLVSKDHKSRMPKGWICFEGSNFARYEHCVVKIREEKIPVYGTLQS
jgi:hypothetical protein